jgi:TolB-like protein/Tfp pilus assembly protein PilF
VSIWEAGSQVGPYVLLSGIGAGSMGDVWKARDTRLERIVAIKRLRVPGATIEREARTIAGLNHPHICTLHDVGSDYLVMEFVDGTPLAGPMDAADATRIALQIVGALEAAHAKGIIHRDLKPANILLADGRAKLLDFGIARSRVGVTPDSTMTSETTVSGTPAYMAPEQAQGRAADARSDIFSFGAVLYEMLSGRRAFDGPSTIETLTAVLRDDPMPLDAPPALTQIVKRCLEKSPAHRYQTAAELRTALEQLPTTEETGASIAVLPFANLSSDPEQEYFSDGLTEEIINALAHVPGLKVIARTSAFAFKGQQLSIGRIAEALGVSTILEGSVRRAGNRIRVTAQLVDVSNGFHLWSERYDRELADVFAVQDGIASAIASELRGRFRADEPSPSYTPKVAAYEAYMMARHHVWQGLSRERFAQGLRCYEQAIALDPRFALPHAALAEMFHIVASGKGPEAQAAAARIRPSVERAVALDPALPEAHAWLGVIANMYDYNWAEGERQFRQAMAREPVTPVIRHMNAYFNLRFTGRAEEAIAEHHRAIEQDPLNMIIRVGLAVSLTSAERHAEASQVVDTLMELAPDFPAIYGLLARNVALAPLEQALAFAERFYARTIFNAAGTGLFAGLLRRNGDDRRASELMAQAGPPDEYGNAVGYALYHLASGETDRAFDFMQLAVDQRHPLLMMITVGGPYAPALRASSRWPAFARRIGLA